MSGLPVKEDWWTCVQLCSWCCICSEGGEKVSGGISVFVSG